MVSRKTVAAVVVVAFFLAGTTFAQTLEDNWNDFLHYIKIGRFDLAKGFGQAVLQSNPDSAKLLALSKANPQGYEILQRVNESAPDPELAELTRKILGIVEQGRFTRRADPRIIVEEIRRLSTTERGRLTAVKRLQNAGEYAIPFMLDVIADSSREDELPYIVWALPQIGKDAIRPLTTALQTENVAVKTEIAKALGKIGYPQSQPFLRYVIEKDKSAEVREPAAKSFMQINPAEAKIPAAQLFYQLAEKYYYHAKSLAPAEDANFANIWFWDPNGQKLVYEEVDKSYFNELMAMQTCEWSLRADPSFGQAIGLWLAAFFKAESAGLKMPAYFGDRHADALVYATTAGVEYLYQALARAVKDKDAYVAIGVVEALATTAGEKSLLDQIGPDQPLIKALSFEDKLVRYSAAIAIASAGPTESFAGSRLVVKNLAEALRENPSAGGQGEGAGAWTEQIANTYALRAAKVMLKLAQTRNRVIDLSPALNILINATNDKRTEIRTLAGQILAHLESPDAQRAIAAMALNSDNSLEVRISAFESLAASAKSNANMLIDQMVDGIYELISSDETDPALRSAAAAAFGALNLPSQKVKDLILDQAKS
jgi:HEAT repeat protein